MFPEDNGSALIAVIAILALTGATQLKAPTNAGRTAVEDSTARPPIALVVTGIWMWWNRVIRPQLAAR